MIDATDDMWSAIEHLPTGAECLFRGQVLKVVPTPFGKGLGRHPTTKVSIREALSIETVNKNPRILVLVGSSSHAFGIGAVPQAHRAREMRPSPMADRVEKFTRARCSDKLSRASAAYSYEHCLDPDFTGGYFRQWDGDHFVFGADLDYTPGTLAAVLDSFMDCRPTGSRIKRIDVNGHPVREFARAPSDRDTEHQPKEATT